MRRVLCGVLLLLAIAGCARAPETRKEPPRPELAPLLELARSPEVELDPTEAPAAPRGFNRVDVLTLANALVDAVERTGTADPEEIASERDAVDHTFAGLDMRSRREITDDLEATSEHYKDMPVDWAVTDRWETGHRPASSRVVKASWRTKSEGGYLGVTLQVVRAHVDAGGRPMFLNRTFELWNSDPSRAPATQTYFNFTAGVTGVDRCHLVRTGRLRPDTDADRARRGADLLRQEISARGVTTRSDSDFRRGCD